MPANTKIARCVRDVMAKGRSKVSAIKICVASTKQAYPSGKYATGRPPKSKSK